MRNQGDGIADWVRRALGPAADGWPEHPTTIVAYEIESKQRVAFGTVGSPDIDIATAVAASAAVPMVFSPVTIHGKRYVDGGIASGTNADLVLGHQEPLDLLIVIAPLLAARHRDHARFHEEVLGRIGESTLTAELDSIHNAWPETELLVLRPEEEVLDEARPNLLSPAAALPVFLRTLQSMSTILALLLAVAGCDSNGAGDDDCDDEIQSARVMYGTPDTESTMEIPGQTTQTFTWVEAGVIQAFGWGDNVDGCIVATTTF